MAISFRIIDLDKYKPLEKSFVLPIPSFKGRFEEDLTFSEEKLSDKKILKLLRQGDESALGHIYSRYIRDLYRFGSQVSQNEEIVKDCIQDVFVTLIRLKIPLKKVKSIKSYLYKSLYRAIVEKLRRERRYLADHPVLYNPGGFEIEISGESRLINEETYRLEVAKMNEQLQQLSKKQKTAILLYYYEGFSHEEIAGLMHLSNKNSVTKLIRRALDTIRKGLLILFILLLMTYL